MKYNGGGDWYSNPTSVPNLITFCNDNLKTNIDPVPGTVEPGSADLFNYAYVDLTGHGNVFFSDSEAANLRTYLESGGFLHISDNYGIDLFIRREMKKVFPELDFIELPNSHPIYSQKYRFPDGLPKIHEHDGKPAQGFGLIYKGRLVCFYSYESGKTVQYITTRKMYARKPCKWGRILFRLYLISKCPVNSGFTSFSTI